MDNKDKPYYIGHRKRTKEKFLSNLSIDTNYTDLELLELILFYAIPRVDVKPLARELLQQYSSLNELLAKNHYELQQNNHINANTATLIVLIKAIAIHLLKRKVRNKPALNYWSDLLDYCYLKLAHEKREMIKVLYLNNKLLLISDEILYEGTINKIIISEREIIKRCIEIGATSYVLVHNHPSGIEYPSPEDITTTQHLAQATAIVNIILHDHIIVSEHDVISFKDLGLL